MVRERRLLVVTESLGVGGTESHLLRVLPELAKHGWDIAVFCISERGRRASQLEAGGVKVFCSRRTREQSVRRSAADIVASARDLYSLMHRGWRPTIAHFYLPGPYLIGAPAAIAAGTPLKVMSRRSLSRYQQNWPITALLERGLHGHMDALIGNSRAVVNELISEGVPAHRVRLIYNGINCLEPRPRRSEARRALGIDENTLLIIVIANLIHYKGHEELVRGLVSVRSKLPSTWRVLLAGRDHGMLEHLQRMLNNGGIAENVNFIGEIPDVSRLLAAADFGMLTSREEGFSNVILEGMSAGLPMIVTAVGGNSEAVRHGQTGLVVPPRDAPAIGAAVLQLANDPQLCRRLGAAARARVQKEFSLSCCVHEHASLYDELVLSRPLRNVYTTSRPGPTRGLDQIRPWMFAYWGRYGALPQFTLELAEASRRAGELGQTTFSISTDNELFSKYQSLGDALFPVQTYSVPFAAFLNIAAVRRLRRELIRRLVADRTRAFITLMPHVWSPLTAPVFRSLGIRHTVIIHDADPHLGDRTALLNRWLLREAKFADQVVTLTTSVAQRLVCEPGIEARKVTVLFHPDLTYTPARFEPEKRALRVMFFGRILPYKGLDVFVEAMEILRRTNQPIEVGVFGAGHMGQLRSKLAAMGAEMINRWIEPIEIAEILGRHDVVVVSHLRASQSGVIAAAYGAGLPVVCTPVGGLTEQVLSEVTGLIAAQTTAEAIAEAVKRLANDRGFLHRLKMGVAANRRMRSMDRFFAELKKIALDGTWPRVSNPLDCRPQASRF